jgi:hypothetical protein
LNFFALSMISASGSNRNGINSLHVVVNDCGELLIFQLSPGNCDDRTSLSTFAPRLFGTLFETRATPCKSSKSALYMRSIPNASIYS